ncbi:MAG: hypothetical protein ACI9EQ_000369 [Bacteroidia bacterium]|jgi:hypothetical protein
MLYLYAIFAQAETQQMLVYCDETAFFSDQTMVMNIFLTIFANWSWRRSGLAEKRDKI